MKQFWGTAILCASLAMGGAAGAQDVDLRLAGSSELEETLTAASLSLALDETATPQDVIAAAQADYGRLLSALYAEAHYSATISIQVDGVEAAQISPLAQPSAVRRVVITVDPGRPFTLGRAAIDPEAAGTVLPSDFTPGAPAGVDVVRSATEAAITGWRDIGHAKASVSDQAITARHPDAELDVAIRLDPGPRLTFGAVTVTGNDAVREARIRAIAGVPEGETFSPAALELAATRLRRTGTFASVALAEAEQIGPEQTLPIEIQVAERKPRRLRFGAEISSVDGLTLSGGWLHRNLLGGAERFEVVAEVSGLGGTTGGEDATLSFRFDRPATFGPDADLYALLEFSQINDVDTFSRQVRAELGATRIVSDRLTLSLGLGVLSSTVEDDLGERSFTLVTLPLSLTWDTRDDALNARSGVFVTSEITPFLNVDGSANGARLTFDGRTYFSASERLTFALRGQGGAIWGPEIIETPSEFLFYSGGGGTVRGHSYQALGVEAGGARTGGLGFAALSAEARYDITETIGVVGFFDVGVVSADADFSDTGSHSGAGIGVRYQTGLGPIRLDVAVPVDGDGDGVQIYIGIGQAF